MTWQENQINLTRNNIIIYFYHHRRRHHLLFYLVVIQSLAFLLHQQRMLSYVCHTEPLQHMPAGNDTMIYCVSGRANNYGKSSQSHEKIVGNACERKQIEIFYDTTLFCFVFFLSLVFFDESVSFGLNRIYWYFFSPSFRFFLRDRKKKHSWSWDTNEVPLRACTSDFSTLMRHGDHSRKNGEASLSRPNEVASRLYVLAPIRIRIKRKDQTIKPIVVTDIKKVTLPSLIVASFVDWIATSIAVQSPHRAILWSFRHPSIDWT